MPNPEDELSIIPAESAERHGPAPTVAIAGDVDAEVDEVVRRVEELYSSRSPSRFIAVLYGDAQKGSKALPKRIVDALSEASIPTFWVTDRQQPDNKNRAGSADEAVIVSTIYSAKGLEFPNVIVCGLGAREDETTARKLIYVGLTRAVDRLTVVARADSPFATDIEQAAPAR